MNKNENKLPPYLGYGVLDPVSYTISGEKAFADYHYQGLPILKVEQSDKGARIEELYGDNLRYVLWRKFGASHISALPQFRSDG